MSGLSHEEVRHHVKIYMRVFSALAILTVATVSVSYLHLPLWPAITIALLIAIFKGSLVAGFFMHLFYEKRLIFVLLALAVFFFMFLLLVPVITSG